MVKEKVSIKVWLKALLEEERENNEEYCAISHYNNEKNINTTNEERARAR